MDVIASMQKNTRQKLLNWFQKNKRPWPWRMTKDPYSIWVSEVMLQQTTSAAVVAFYERFLSRFPTVQSLAAAKIEDVLEYWSGLGYYSRARNLHKAAQIIGSKASFPNTHVELLDIPGFGPYTARSVASLAFAKPVGVLDGNVIRVVSRLMNEKYEWWQPKVRAQMQKLVDNWVQGVESAQMNQALMELGATICLPKIPKCLICPVAEDCEAFKKQTTQSLPLRKSKRAQEIWLWQAKVWQQGDKIQLIKNDYAPFLKGHWFLPGKAKKLSLKPKKYSFKHTVTHHDIYVQVEFKKARMTEPLITGKHTDAIWTKPSESRSLAPANLVQKILRLNGGVKS